MPTIRPNLCLFCDTELPDEALHHIPAEIMRRKLGFTYAKCRRHERRSMSDALREARALVSVLEGGE